MKNKEKKNLGSWWIFIIGVLLVIGVIYLVASAAPLPYRLVTKYPIGMLVDEADQMHECAECHETESFHTCDTCHNEHGSAVFAGLNFYSTIQLTGDVSEEKFIPTNQIFLNDDAQEIDEVAINDFLKQNGVDEFASITFASNDGGFTTVEKDQLGDTSYLVPFENGVRFADEKLHESTWIKGINKIIVTGNQKDLTIGDQAYSLGELMLMDTVKFTVEQAQVMLKSEQDGVIRKGYTAERLEGIEISRLIDLQPLKSYSVTFGDDSIQDTSYEEMLDSKLLLIGKQITLVFPDKARNQWLFGVKSIEEKA